MVERVELGKQKLCIVKAREDGCYPLTNGWARRNLGRSCVKTSMRREMDTLDAGGGTKEDSKFHPLLMSLASLET